MLYLTQSDEIKAIIDDLKEVKILWLDTETADYKSKRPRLSLIQVLAYPQDTTGARTCILDVLGQTEVIDYFINQIMINENINAQYDLRFLGGKNANNVTCTLEMAKKIPYHILPVPNRTLKTLTETLTSFQNLDKELQSSDWGIRPLTPTQLEYAKMDTVYLAHIHHALLKLLEKSEFDPRTDNINQLAQRYREIHPQ